jgi:pilus assembly protein CpaF
VYTVKLLAYALNVSLDSLLSEDDVLLLDELASAAPARAVTQRPRTSRQVAIEVLGDFSNADFVAQLVRWAVEDRRSVLVSGPMGSGKTSFLRALGGVLPNDEKVVVIENTPELQLDTATAIVTPISGSHGREQTQDESLTIRDLIRAVLAKNPDRIIVGELKSVYAADVLAFNAHGHDGTLSTVHASSAAAVVPGLMHEIQSGGISEKRAAAMVSGGTDIVVHMQRFDGTPQVHSVAQVVRAVDNRPFLHVMWKRDRKSGDLVNVAPLLDV